MKVVSVIPARGGSKGIPLKNIVELGGKPLISYTIESSKQSNVDETWVSTDSGEIASVVSEYGVRVIERPEDISTTNTVSSAKIAEAQIEYVGAGILDSATKPGWGSKIFRAISPF